MTPPDGAMQKRKSMQNTNNLCGRETQELFTAVVPAAGIGSRMQTTRPKQYLPLNGKTVIEVTLERLLTHPAIDKVVVVINPNDTDFHSLPVASHPDIVITIGGDERSDSVLNGLNKVTSTWVLVHDAARPCIRHKDIDELLKLSVSGTGGILAAQATDTMKLATTDQTPGTVSEVNKTLNRQLLWRALTPQLFTTQALKDAIAWCDNKGITITDEASAIEQTGGTVKLVPGNTDNIKITHPGDLALAEFYLQQQERQRSTQ